MNNEKGIWCLDIVTEEEHYYPNTLSPKFIRILFEKVLDMEESEAKEYFKNNFVDILVDPKWSLNFPFASFADDMKGYRRLDFVPRLSNVEDEDGVLLENTSSDLEKIDIIELSKRLIYNTGHSTKVKDRLVGTIKTLYERVQKTQEEKEEEL
jgi:hypothetical protein